MRQRSRSEGCRWFRGRSAPHVLQRGQGEHLTIPEGETLLTLLTSQATRSPNATALICGEDRLTYSELHARASRLAKWLVAYGVGPDTLVGICLPRTIDLIISIIAVHKCGGAYLSLDPSYPQQRLRFMVEDSNTEIILTDRSHAAQLTHT